MLLTPLVQAGCFVLSQAGDFRREHVIFGVFVGFLPVYDFLAFLGWELFFRFNDFAPARNLGFITDRKRGAGVAHRAENICEACHTISICVLPGLPVNAVGVWVVPTPVDSVVDAIRLTRVVPHGNVVFFCHRGLPIIVIVAEPPTITDIFSQWYETTDVTSRQVAYQVATCRFDLKCLIQLRHSRE